MRRCRCSRWPASRAPVPASAPRRALDHARVRGERTDSGSTRPGYRAGDYDPVVPAALYLTESDEANIAELPFESGRRCMTTVHRLADGRFLSITKGAAEVIVVEHRSPKRRSSGPVGHRPRPASASPCAREDMAAGGAARTRNRAPLLGARYASETGAGRHRAAARASWDLLGPDPIRRRPEAAQADRDLSRRRDRAGHDHRRPSGNGARDRASGSVWRTFHAPVPSTGRETRRPARCGVRGDGWRRRASMRASHQNTSCGSLPRCRPGRNRGDDGRRRE